MGTIDTFILTGCSFYICPNTAQFRGKIKRAESIPASPVFYQLLEEFNSYSILHRSTGIWCGTGTRLWIQQCQRITEAGSTLCRSSRITPCSKQESNSTISVLSGFEYLQECRLHNLSEQPVLFKHQKTFLL